MAWLFDERRMVFGMRAHIEEKLASRNHSWAKVELYRWQHGELPPQDGEEKPLDVPTALREMARALMGEKESMPSPQNVASVLNFCADELEKKKKFPRKAHVFGKLVISTCNQASGAAFIDRAFTEDIEGHQYASVAILLTPWKRNRFGESLPQLALVIGWRNDRTRK